MGKRTGNPRGRPPKPKVTQPVFVAVSFGLSEAEIQGLLPRDVLRMITHHAIRVGNVDLAFKVANAWAPFEHARKIDPSMTPEEIRRAIDIARSEAARRNYDLTNVARLPDRTGERGDATGTNG